jgi:hypothetical protein
MFQKIQKKTPSGITKEKAGADEPLHHVLVRKEHDNSSIQYSKAKDFPVRIPSHHQTIQEPTLRPPDPQAVDVG